MLPRTLLAFLAPREHCWLRDSLLFTRTLRSFSTRWLFSRSAHSIELFLFRCTALYFVEFLDSVPSIMTFWGLPFSQSSIRDWYPLSLGFQSLETWKIAGILTHLCCPWSVSALLSFNSCMMAAFIYTLRKIKVEFHSASSRNIRDQCIIFGKKMHATVSKVREKNFHAYVVYVKRKVLLYTVTKKT